MNSDTRKLLEAVQQGAMSVDEALLALKRSPSLTSVMQKWTCTGASARGRRR